MAIALYTDLVKISGQQRVFESKRPQKGGTTTFCAKTAASATANAEILSPIHAQTMDAIFSMLEQPTDSSRHLAHQGYNLLDLLDNLRKSILCETLSRNDLEKVRRQLNAIDTRFIDEALAEIITDIQVRAAVELAKYDRSC